MTPTTRHIRRHDMVACKLAFIDCKMPGSTDKENYSLIGPGVTQSPGQLVNITEPHGFSLGVAAMPPGTTNNLHLHHTAEVFMVFSGTWRFRWGANGDDGEITGGPGDVVSIPTRIFRGFSNIGRDHGWIFTALGGDDTGGIIWHPTILATAAEHGLYLTRENTLVDTTTGAPKPADADIMPPLDAATTAGLRHISPEAMAARTLPATARPWSTTALLDSALPNHASRLAPVLGHGINQDLEHETPIPAPHGFSLDWLQIPPGNTVGPFRLAEKQVLIVFTGAIAVTLDAAPQIAVATQEVFSTPAHTWRSLTCTSETPAEIAVLTAGDHKKHPEWSREITRAAAAHGLGLDHAGYIACLALLPEERKKELLF